MFCFERKIYYIDKYEKEERIGNAGFLSITFREKDCQIHIGLRGLKPQGALTSKWYALQGEDKIFLEEIKVVGGQADFKKVYPDRKIGKEEIPLERITGYYFSFDKNLWGKCYKEPEHREGGVRTVVENESQNHRGSFEDLLQTYPVIQPFASQGDYVKIEPMTLKILAPEYRKLADNSFLLHGYYSYQHIILGYYQDENREGYYLGVPGSFEITNQQMAGLFGFEGYEHSGDSGYYMRKVEF